MFEQVPNYVELDEKVSLALAKYNNHPSIITIKRNISITQKFEFSHVYPWEVIKFVEVLDTNKSTSGDIPTKIIKMAKESICPYLSDCINAAIYNCTFPDELKKADVSAIFQKGDPGCKGNYRPISILAARSNIYERNMGVQMNSYFNGILSALLSGFRQGYSTQHSLFRATETWKRCLDTNGTAGTILIDLSKAYDSIPHDFFVAKLEAYGFGKKELKLAYSYLSNQKLRVKVGSAYSTSQNISTGVPQGSVLGPLLFNISINDMLHLDLESEICNFADDTTIYTCDKSINTVIVKLEDDLQKLLGWFKENGMCANTGKFQTMLLRLKINNFLCLNIHGQKNKIKLVYKIAWSPNKQQIKF